jgi:hypothetical protein
MKLSFTALGTILSDGDKLPLRLFTKDETDRCHQKFDKHPNIRIRHTNKSWTADNLLSDSIQWFTTTVTDETLC